MRSLLKFAALAAVGFFSVNAQALVTINPGIQFARGQMGSAAIDGREGADIGCSLSGAYISCYADDGLGQTASCYSSDARYMRLFSMVGKTSTITFQWDSNNVCNRLDVNNSNYSTGQVSAGAPHDADPITVVSEFSYAYGSISPLRDVSVAGPTIECLSSVFYIQCKATDASGTYASCYAIADSPYQTLENMRIAIAGINESSDVFFAWDGLPPSQAHCTSISVTNSSVYLP